MGDEEKTERITCAGCGAAFAWEAAYRAQNTPGSTTHNPPGHGVFRPRAYCPLCGALVAEWHIDRGKDYDEWGWYRENAALNQGNPLPPNPLLWWGKEIPTALLPTIDEDHLAVEKARAMEAENKPNEAESTPEAVQLARQAGELLNQGQVEQAAQLYEQAAAAGLNRRDQGFAWSAVGMYYLWKWGDAEQAFRYCRRGEELAAGANWQGNYVLSLMYAAAGMNEQAEQEMRVARRFAGTVWWDGGVDRELKIKLQDWVGRNGEERLTEVIERERSFTDVEMTDAEQILRSAQNDGTAEEEATAVKPEAIAAETAAAVAAVTTAADVAQATALPAESKPMKKCPQCGEQIRLEARICRFCKTRFELSESGYCGNCHKVVENGVNGKCPTCQGELIDRRIETRVAGAGSIAALRMTGADGEIAMERPVEKTGDGKTADERGSKQIVGKKRGAAGVLSFWGLYFLPKGRIDRKTYLLEGLLPLAVIFTPLIMLAVQSNDFEFISGAPGVWLSVLLMLMLGWVFLMLMVKRLHDLGASGWMTLFWVIPLAAGPVVDLFGVDSGSLVWTIVGVFGVVLLVVSLARCIFGRGKVYFNRYREEPSFQRSDANSLSVKETLRRRRLALGAVMAAVLIPLGLYSAWGYWVDQNHLRQGLAALEQADCSTAISQLDQAMHGQRLYDFGGVRMRAKESREACLPFQAAVEQQAKGDYPGALLAFSKLALDEATYPSLGEAAGEKAQALFAERAVSELASVEVCGLIDGIEGGGLIPQAEAKLPEIYLACGEVYLAADKGSEAAKLHQRILAEYPEHELAGQAEKALLDNLQACELATWLASEPAITGRGDFLARYYFGCGQNYEQANSDDKAISVYKQLMIRYPEHALASKAEKALLANPATCDQAEGLKKESAFVKRGSFLPNLLYNCGQGYMDQKKYAQAVLIFQAFLADYPGDNRAESVEKALASALVKDAKASGAGEIERPQKSGSTGSGVTEVVLQNDSPARLRIVFSGPEARIEELAACSTCTKFMFSPFSCPEKGPIGRYTLPAGQYEVLVESISESGVTPYTGDWELVSGDEYYSCFFILEQMRFGNP